MSFVSVEKELKWLLGRNFESTRKILGFLAQNPGVEQWLEIYDENGERVIDYDKIYDLSRDGNTLTVVCHPALCFELWKREKQLFQSTQLLLTIIEKRLNGRVEVYATSSAHPFCVRELRGSLILDKNMLATQNKCTQSQWFTSSNSHSAALADYWEKGTVTIHSADAGNGFKHLYIQPLLDKEAVLSKPIVELIGAPAATSVGEIGEKRSYVIEKAIRNGGSAIESYTFYWQGVEWKKKLKAIYLRGHEEVLVETTGESWHVDYWRNWVG